jgi:HlyD family secretion protein
MIRNRSATRAAALLLALGLAASGLGSCSRLKALAAGAASGHAAAQERPPRAVTAVAALRRDFALSSEQAARISPSLEVNVTPKVGGRVQRLGAEVGQSVKKGQVLARLDPSDYEAQYRQAKAALGGARAGLARTSESGQEQLVVQAQAAADQAAVGYDDAKALYDKTRRLFDGGAVARQQLDDVEARFKAASIQRDAARRSLALVKNKAGSQSSEIASRQVDAARAQADLARSQLDSATIRSPIAGRVSYRGAEEGELIGTSTLAFVVIDDSSVVAEAGLSERQIGLVSRGMALEVVVPALGEEPFAGKVDSASPASDPRSLLYLVKVRVQNPDGRIKGGMIAKLRLPLETHRGAVVLPERGIFSENGGDYAFVAVPEAGGAEGSKAAYRAEKRALKLGETDGTYIEALEGLEPGELVVVEGKEFIGSGDPIGVSLAASPSGN